MLSGFKTYLICSIQGRNQLYTYTIPTNREMSEIKELFLEESRIAKNSENNRYFTISDEEVILHEYYNSGLKFIGSPYELNNELHANIKIGKTETQVTIEVTRIFLSRLLTIIVTLLSVLFSSSVIIASILMLQGKTLNTSRLLMFIFFSVVFYATLILLWKLSLEKPNIVKKMIEAIVAG